MIDPGQSSTSCDLINGPDVVLVALCLALVIMSIYCLVLVVRNHRLVKQLDRAKRRHRAHQL